MFKFIRIRILPLLIILGIIGYVISIIYSREPEAELNMAEIEAKNAQTNIVKHKKQNEKESLKNAEIEIENLRFAGKDKKDSPYEFNAKKAIKTSEGVYEAADIDAILKFNNSKVKINSQKGHFEEKNEYVVMNGGIKGYYDGYNLEGLEGNIYLNTKNFLFTGGIKIYNDKMTIKSERAKSQGEEIIEFEGDVETILYFDN